MILENLFLIGEVSKMKGMTIKALRYYERIGLLLPHYIDPENHYRYYHPDQFVFLDIIKAARSMDMSPLDLVPFFEKKDSKGLLHMLQQHKAMTMDRIRTLEKMVKSLDQVTQTMQYAQEVEKTTSLYVRNNPDRPVLFARADGRQTKEEILRIFSDLELSVDRLEGTNTYESGVVFEKERGSFFPSYYYTSVMSPIRDPNACVIPGGEYVCVQCAESTIQEQTKKITRYLRRNRLDVSLIVQVELLCDLFEESGLIEMQFKTVQDSK